MLYLVILILIIIILFLIWKGFLGKRGNKPPLPPKADPPLAETPPIPDKSGAGGEPNEGICAAATGKSREKMENKQKILEFLEKNGKATNSELRELLKVSEKTVCNYMDELEKSGEARQVGETGKWTHYTPK